MTTPVRTTSQIPAVTDLAAELARQIEQGVTPRATLGAQDVAFAWTTGLPPLVANVAVRSLVEGGSFDAVVISPVGGPPPATAEGGTKPTLVQLTPQTVALSKYAGLAVFSTERAINTDLLVPAVGAVLIGQCLRGFDVACIAALAAAAPAPILGTTWSAAILAGVGEVIGNGGYPSVLVMNPADYAAAVESPGQGYAADPTTAVPSLFGLQIILSAAVTAGTAYVLDPGALMVGQAARSPYVVLDPYSGLSTNEVRIAGEVYGGVIVPAASCVAAVSKSP